MQKTKLAIISALALVVIGLVGCTIRFSFSGASISPDVNTVKVDYFPNMAAMVTPILSPTLNDALVQKIQNQTRLQFVNENPDVYFEGQIVDYSSKPVAISGDEYAETNRLTIAVQVKFTNIVEPNLSFSKSFSAYADFPSTDMLTSVESSLIPEICTQLVDDIFNAAFANW
ncbi:MAG: LptE family protein [Rikenellaceae bacterium]